MEEEKQAIQFISCPECNGRGRNDKNFSCKNCGGLGLVAFLDGELLYWGLNISRTSIALRKLKHRLDILSDVLAFFIFFGGFGSLLFWLWKNSEGVITPSSLFFWQEKSPLILAFWISCLAAMFLIYKMDKRNRDEARIKQVKIIHSQNFPNNWEELRRFKKRVDVSIAYKEKTLTILEDAYLLALKLKHKEVGTLHLFSALLKSVKVAVLFTRLNVGGKDLVEKINHQLAGISKDLKKESEMSFSNDLKEILISSFVEGYELKQKSVNALNILLPCLEKNLMLKEILLDLKVDDNKVKNTIAWFRISEKQVNNYRTYRKLARLKPSSTMDRAYTAVATPFLNNFGYDLTLAAKWGRLDVCIARDKEIKNIFEALESGKSGVLLTGPEGAGKRTVIEGIAREMVIEENIPNFLRDKRLIELDVARLVSGASPTVAQERMLTIIDEIHRAKNIVLFLENIENIMGIAAGGEESLELSEVLSGELERGSLFCFATVSETNYLKYIEGKAMGNAFVRIKIDEPVGDNAIMILESKVGYLEAKHNIFFSYSAVEAARDLSAKFIHDKYLPTKAIEVLEKTAARVANEQKGKKYICDKNDVAITINQITDIPTQDLAEDESAKLLNLEEELHKYMIGQEEAVSMVSDALRRSRAELSSGKRPIANFLFLGPTGVGKTELAKTITKVYFQRKDFMIRLDMSEYQQEDSVNKMIGDVDGTKGYLTEAVRQKPFSLILLDEFEKANPKILNLFLQVMDDGRLTDGQGRTVDFTNSIIIATSNAGSDYIQTEVKNGTPIEQIKEVLINEHLNKVMRPELVNRFDGIIVFTPLTQEDVAAIARLMLGDTERMLKAKGIGLETTEAGIQVLATGGYDPKFGARPLRRLIQDKIENEIAKKFLAGELKRRDVVYINDLAEIEVKKGQEL